MLQAQKKAKKADTAPSTGAGNAEAAAAAKKARAAIAGIRKLARTPSLKAMRNKILKRAIKAFEEEGRWTSGHLYYGNSMCAIGAIKKFGKGAKPAQQAAVFAVVDAIDPDHEHMRFGQEYELHESWNVVRFNDKSETETHKARVIGAFKEALSQPIRRHTVGGRKVIK